MSDKKIFEFYYTEINNNIPVAKKEDIESRGYKRAVKSFQIKYPNVNDVHIQWKKEERTCYKEQKLPMGRKKKIGR